MDLAKNIKDSKPHYVILDGLRGVAAILVVLFHIVEVYSKGDHTKQIINHGYLAVDFFFLLSGFVLGYAYDDRWDRMTLKDFFKRRIIRLQPMIIIGSIIGALLFYFQNSPSMGWGGISSVPVWKMLLVMLIGCTLIPVGKGLDIRGWDEMHPLNGPAWSLFYEYIANIIYALILRRVSKSVLIVLVALALFLTAHYALTNPQGDIIGGWSVNQTQLSIGFTRLAFPFLAGLLLARTGKLKFTRNAFLSASILLILLLAMPRIGGTEAPWENGLYECFCLFLMFPFIIWLGAGGKIKGKNASKFCKTLGDISYPMYITHYPLIYIFTAWVANHNYTLAESWPRGALVALLAIVLTYGYTKLLDIPIRQWLRKRFL